MNREEKMVAHFIREYLRPTETFVINQIRALKKNGNFEPTVFCKKIIEDDNTITQDLSIIELCKYGSTIEKILGNISYNYFRKLDDNSVIKTIEELNVRKIKILHFHYLVDARFYIKVIRKSKLPSVISVYGYDVAEFPKRHMGLGLHYLQPVLNEADFILAMSNDMKNDLLKIGCKESKIIVHYHGINVNRFINENKNYAHKNPINILFCGQLTHKKAPLMIIKSLKLIEEKQLLNVPLNLIFVGDGPLRGLLQKEIAENHLRTKVTLLGHIPHSDKRLLEEYRKADIFILPSMVAKNDKEGIPGTLVEAMASGLPVISSRHAGIPEIVKTGENGLLIEEGDCCALANKICKLVNNAELRKKLGLNSLRKAKELTLETKTMELEKIYSMILETGKNNI
jgi:colanic acid/amylovoran biosynthesis glycosyltransferase